jgi:hypothetical protein
MWTESEILAQIGALLKRTGRLSFDLVEHTAGMPVSSTIRRHFGSLTRVYELLGYRLSQRFLRMTEMVRRARRLREEVLARILTEGRGCLTLQRAGCRRAMLLVDGRIRVSLLMCPTLRTPNGNIRWRLTPASKERGYITLLCRLDAENREVHSLFMFSQIDWASTHRLRENDPWLANGMALRDFSQVRRGAYSCSALGFPDHLPEQVPG